MKKCIKIFFDPIEGRERYLNEMALKGLQLEESTSFVHKFSKSNCPNIHYSVQYIGYMNNKERLEYIDFLQSLNLKVFFAPLNLGKFAIKNVRYRPYNNARASIATTSGMINREILIIESKGNNEVPVFTDDFSRHEDLLRRKMPYRYLSFVSIVFIIIYLSN